MAKKKHSSLLDQVSIPADLRKLAESDLPRFADELRQETIEVVSRSGGHLGAGLGVVELTTALHYVFDSPHDKLVWDVGHQSYPHKIITGRRARITSLRQGGGISGFTSRSESLFDPFGAAHSSTSISAALGMAAADKLSGVERNVVAIIGDGAMSAGMAFEAINNAGANNLPIIIVLNDNNMSISPPVGALSNYLNKLSDSDTTFPTIFDHMGIEYIGPIDGHDFRELLPTFKKLIARKRTGPVIVHTITRKGHGYSPAENSDDKFHGVKQFCVETGAPSKASTTNLPSFTSVFSSALCEAAAEDDKVVAITAAMPSGTGLEAFANLYPDRFFDVGIAEQHAVTFAAGMTTMGYRPVAAIYSTFLQRAYDQIVHDVALQCLPVRFAIDRAGLVGEDGPTHAGSFDLAYLCTLPNFVVMAAADGTELSRMVTTALEIDDRPSAFRYPRDNVPEHVDRQISRQALEIGKGRIIQEGNRIAILSLGSRLATVKVAAAELAKRGLSVTIADARFAKPIDLDLVTTLANNHEALIILEEGSSGGFGDRVISLMAQRGLLERSLKVRSLVLPDMFIAHDSLQRQYEAIAFDVNGIIASVESLLDVNADYRITSDFAKLY